jgi:hypothetical protein
MANMRAIQGTAVRRPQGAIEAAYDHFRVDRQGNLVSGNTVDHNRYLVVTTPVVQPPGPSPSPSAASSARARLVATVSGWSGPFAANADRSGRMTAVRSPV